MTRDVAKGQKPRRTAFCCEVDDPFDNGKLKTQ